MLGRTFTADICFSSCAGDYAASSRLTALRGTDGRTQMKVGDKVRLVAIPDDIVDDAEKSIYERCLGHEFSVAAFNDLGYAELQIEAITGTSGDKIHVSHRFLKAL